MENTYTYIARSVENPEQVVTFTLQDHHMSVGLGTPLEKIETIVQETDAGEEATEEANQEAGQGASAKLWLKPLAVSLLERSVGPFRVWPWRQSRSWTVVWTTHQQLKRSWKN
jgi:hypothetical protein